MQGERVGGLVGWLMHSGIGFRMDGWRHYLAGSVTTLHADADANADTSQTKWPSNVRDGENSD